MLPRNRILSLVLLLAVGSQANAAMEITSSSDQKSNPGPAETFTGEVQVKMLFSPPAPARTSGAEVTFSPSARTHWHTHPFGQILVVTKGSGQVQEWGQPIRALKVGDVVWTPPGVKHWHGASATTSLTHYAITEAKDGKPVDWLEPVTDQQFQDKKKAK